MFSLSTNYNISLTTLQLCQEAELTFLSFSLDLYLALIFKVALKRDATLTHNINCHFTLLHNQKVTVFASSKDERTGRIRLLSLGISLGPSSFFLRKECMTHLITQASLPLPEKICIP